MINKRLDSTQRIGPHNIDILEIVIGSLLGDGSMEKDNKLSPACRFAFQQEKPNSEYLLWLHAEIAKLGYCKPNIPQIMSRLGENGSMRYSIRFRTYTYSSFNWIYEGFYKTDINLTNNKTIRRKIVPEFIKDYLTPRALAIWLMDDGCYHKKRGIKFATNSFTLNEVKFLGSILKSKYNLDCSIHKTGVVNQYNIYIPKKDLNSFIKIVKPHIHQTMLYKLGLAEKLKQF